MAETRVACVTLVGSCCHKKHCGCMLFEIISKPIVLSLFSFAFAIVSRAQTMSFVENDKVPFTVLEQFLFVFFTLQAIQRCDGAGFKVPYARIDGMKVALKDLEELSKLILHLLLPLHSQARWTND